MRCLIIMAVIVLAAGTARAQVKGQISTQTGSATSAKSGLQAASTNQVYRSSKNPKITYSGSAVQAVKTRNPLQLINPLAPASYGSGEANTVRDPNTGRVDGFRLFTISFW